MRNANPHRMETLIRREHQRLAASIGDITRGGSLSDIALFFSARFPLIGALLLKASNHPQHRSSTRAAVAFVFTMIYRRCASLESKPAFHPSVLPDNSP
jgi:hypothetical protein